jgi:branched-chain amino acid transport system substrate-binding protein
MAGAPVLGAEKVVKIGMDLSLTGADSEGAIRIRNGIMMAIDAVNEVNGIPGYKIEPMLLDDGTSTAGQYDPAQAATNARKMVSDQEVVGALGPEMSGAGKAMAPILSMGGLATITPTSTNPDISDPTFAQQFRPAGKPIYFRTVTTDAYQGPNMANF